MCVVTKHNIKVLFYVVTFNKTTCLFNIYPIIALLAEMMRTIMGRSLKIGRVTAEAFGFQMSDYVSTDCGRKKVSYRTKTYKI